MRLIGKVRLSGKIKAETGLHIGGSKTALDIGGIDLNVIKTAEGVPFIPGSSLKGKLRSILAREHGSIGISRPKWDSDKKNAYDDGIDVIRELFGTAGDKKEGCPSRIMVRDASLDSTLFDAQRENGIFSELEMDYTESKWENTIVRKSGTAINPRPVERVPAGAEFNFEIIYNVFNEGKTKRLEHLNALIKALRILEDDYLGGQGSRGYGKISFKDVEFRYKTIKHYKNGNDWQELTGFEL
jgi:CRISPR-associated protein Csm3